MPTPTPNLHALPAWFAGPKGENSEWFSDTIRRIIQDYHSWRRNYFPEDGVLIDSHLRREAADFYDNFEDRLLELLARLKADYPFYSPRYAAHMLSEQTLPSIAAYFAAMLYNPNNVSSESAPVTVRLELEAAQLIARMVGYSTNSWAHLTGGGTIANLEALWIARSVKYLPFVISDMRAALALPAPSWNNHPPLALAQSPTTSLQAFADVFTEAEARFGNTPATVQRVVHAYLDSPHNVVERGIHAVHALIHSDPVVLVPETHHYCFEKAMDVLGLGRRALLSVPVDADFRMKPEALDDALTTIESQGKHALAVVAVIGSTEEGAVDPVDQIALLRTSRESAGRPSFWLHADGAYGGYLRTVTVPDRLGLGEPRTEVSIAGTPHEIALHLPEHGTCNALEHLADCDSVTIDPHKLGYIPYPSGAIGFKSNIVKAIARQSAPYIAEAPSDVEAERRTDQVGPYILEGSKPGAAAAAVWLSHTLIPLNSSGHGRLIRDTIRNACELHALLEQLPSLTRVPRVQCVPLCPPGSNIVCYAFRPTAPGFTLAQLNAANRRIYNRLTLRAGLPIYDQAFFISRTTLLPTQYSPSAVADFLQRLNVNPADFQREGVFLLRSVLMNPWYTLAKRKGRYYLSELAAELYRVAAEELATAHS